MNDVDGALSNGAGPSQKCGGIDDDVGIERMEYCVELLLLIDLLGGSDVVVTTITIINVVRV